LWPNGWMHQDATWYGARPQPMGLCVRWGPSPLPKKGAQPPPQFSGDFYCAQTPGCIPATRRTDGTPTTTQFLAHVYYDQTAGWMKTPLDTEVDLGPATLY